MTDTSTSWRLLDLFNRILATESRSQTWGAVNIFLIHQKCSVTDPLNYRGILVIDAIAKIFLFSIFIYEFDDYLCANSPEMIPRQSRQQMEIGRIR